MGMVHILKEFITKMTVAPTAVIREHPLHARRRAPWVRILWSPSAGS